MQYVRVKTFSLHAAASLRPCRCRSELVPCSALFLTSFSVCAGLISTDPCTGFIGCTRTQRTSFLRIFFPWSPPPPPPGMFSLVYLSWSSHSGSHLLFSSSWVPLPGLLLLLVSCSRCPPDLALRGYLAVS